MRFNLDDALWTPEFFCRASALRWMGPCERGLSGMDGRQPRAMAGLMRSRRHLIWRGSPAAKARPPSEFPGDARKHLSSAIANTFHAAASSASSQSSTVAPSGHQLGCVGANGSQKTQLSWTITGNIRSCELVQPDWVCKEPQRHFSTALGI